MCHFLILAALHGLNKDGVAVDFHHNHDVLVASLRAHRELTCFIGEHGFTYPVCFGGDVSNYLAWSWEVSHVSKGAVLALVVRTFFLV